MRATTIHSLSFGILLSVGCFANVAAAQQIVAEDSRLTPIGRVAFTEGPAWHSDGSVYFSDIENNRIMRMDAEGRLGVFRTPSGKANGLLFDHQGRLVACEGGSRSITRTETDGTLKVLADRYKGKRFNTPNDITIDSKGFLYFTDPRYGERSGLELFDKSGQAIEGVYRIDPDGSLTRLLADEVGRPNGIAVSPDDKHLYVADNANDDAGNSRCLWRFELDESRNVVSGSQKKLFDWGTDRGPDGMAIDQKGRLYVTAGLNYPAPPHETADAYKAGVYVISPQGKLLETIPVPIDMVTNCAFGGEDQKTLYITAGHKLWSVRVRHPGHIAWLK